MFNDLMDRLAGDGHDNCLPRGFDFTFTGGVHRGAQHRLSDARVPQYALTLTVLYPDGTQRPYLAAPGEPQHCRELVDQAIRDAQRWAEAQQRQLRLAFEARLAEDEAGDAHAYTGHDEILR